MRCSLGPPSLGHSDVSQILKTNVTNLLNRAACKNLRLGRIVGVRGESSTVGPRNLACSLESVSLLDFNVQFPLVLSNEQN